MEQETTRSVVHQPEALEDRHGDMVSVEPHAARLTLSVETLGGHASIVRAAGKGEKIVDVHRDRRLAWLDERRRCAFHKQLLARALKGL